jgi:hypothetical protein
MKIMGDRPNAVRNVGFRGWRRNRDKLRDDTDDRDDGDAAGGPKPAAPKVELSEQDISLKVAKLHTRQDLVELGAVGDAAAVRDAVIAAGGHVGRAAIALRKAKQAEGSQPITADDV